MTEPIVINYRFNYDHKKDTIEFIFSLNNNFTNLTMPYEAFMVLMARVVNTAKPFFDRVTGIRRENIKQDLKVGFDEARWDKMMEVKRDEDTH